MAETTPGYEAALAAASMRAHTRPLTQDRTVTPTPLHGVRVDPDGTVTDITVPDALHMREHLMALLNGYVEYAHYGSRESAVTAVVHETGAVDGHPCNDPATRYIGALRDAMPGYWLHGPVYFFGCDVRHRIVTDLSSEQRAQLHALDPHQPATTDEFPAVPS